MRSEHLKSWLVAARKAEKDATTTAGGGDNGEQGGYGVSESDRAYIGGELCNDSGTSTDGVLVEETGI